jgi:hypothetical protein
MNQYDIMQMMNIGSFEFKEFVIDGTELTHKGLNYWYFHEEFESKEVLCEFLFYYYQYNFYPKVGGWRKDLEGTHSHKFSIMKSRLEQGFEKRKFDEDKLK